MSAKPKESYHEVYKELKANGACKMCAYRFLCNAEFSFFNHEYLLSQGYEENTIENPKMKKSNFCVICLGLYEDRTIEEAKKQVLYEVIQSGYDCKTYMLALVLPTSCKLREHSTFLFLKSKFPSLYQECPYSPRLGLKEAWRYTSCPSISKLINKQLDAKSEMSVQIEFTYLDDWKDCRTLTTVVREQTTKGKPGVSCCMKLLGDAEFAKIFPFPMTVPTHCVEIKAVTIKRDSIFFAGRYNKYSRELSQTPWILADGERKMDLSVEEILSNKLKELMQAADSRFSSSGREDVDVRTLGTGRPFAVELLNPCISVILETDIRKVENEINKIGPELVFVRDLQIVDRSDMFNLKKGEEHKTKEYCCVCVVKKKYSIDFLRSKIPPMPLVIQQKTPIRVLHRRTAAVRPKTIHCLSIDSVNMEPPEDRVVDICEDLGEKGEKTDSKKAGPTSPSYANKRSYCSTIFKVNVITEAGTYIKELVHGDFGRTQPNISTLLGDVPVDVLALDVMNVAVNWPPAINYNSIAK